MQPAEKLAELIERKFIKKSFNEMVRRAEKKGALISVEIVTVKKQ